MTKEEIQKNSEHWYNKYKDAEKRITELENKIADIKANCDLAIEGRDIKIKELEKENAELKKKNLDTQDAVTMQMYTNKANKEIADRQLTKAKELLKEAQGYIENIDDILYDEIEQFIKEIEK